MAVSIFLRDDTIASTAHWSSRTTTFLAPGDRTSSAIMWPHRTVEYWPFLTRVDVNGGETASAIIAIGDSITNGSTSAIDANRRWTDVLAERLLAADGPRYAVVNVGIGGNRILHDGAGDDGSTFGPGALSRFRLPVGIPVRLQPGILFIFTPESFSRSPRNPVRLAPESALSRSACLQPLLDGRDVEVE